MPPIHSPFVSLALSKLRTAVSLCCWTVALSLLTQTLVWCFATFTEIRWDSMDDRARSGGTVIINGSERTSAPSPVIITSATPTTSAAKPTNQDLESARVLSRADAILTETSSISRAAGLFAAALLIPMLAMGLLLGVSSATSGVEHSTSAFIWATVITFIVLPIGGAIGLPWTEGALVSYSSMTEVVDDISANTAEAWGSVAFYARFAFMPLACVAAMAVIGLRFSAGVNAGIIPKESMRLDPILEKEAANVKAGSLHGGRAAGAMRAAGVGAATERKPMTTAGMAMATAGEVPKRLI